MEDQVLSPYLEQFLKLLQTESFLFPETDYAKTAQYFRRRESIPTAEGRDILYEYLCRHGHFCKRMTANQSAAFEKLIEYRNTHFEPFEWHLTDEDYVEKVSQLYDDIQAVLPYENPSPILISQIISVLYGCAPTFDPTLCDLLNIDIDAQYKEQLIQFKKSVLSIGAMIAILSIFSYQLPSRDDQLKEIIDGLTCCVKDALEDKKKKTIMFNKNTTNL